MRIQKSGFTLVEIMIVVAIIGLLAAIAIPSFVAARNTSRANACVNNLRQIDSAKEQYAMAENLADNADVTPHLGAINAYMRGGAPSCPANGTYTYNNIGSAPTCSVGGAHSM